jgi:hypothetical protein
VHDRGVRQRAVCAGAVVVGDEHVQPGRPSGGHLLDRGDRAVDGHQQARPARGEALDGGQGQAVAVVQPAGQIPIDLGSEPPQAAHEHRGGAHPVDVVVAVDRDPRAGARVPEHQVHRGVDPVERPRRMLVGRVEERARRDRRAMPAAHEHLRERVGHPQVALERERGAHVAGGDLEARLIHGMGA